MKFTRVCVIGLGYIGLPTASTFATHGLQVTGVDINHDVVVTLQHGGVHISEPGLLADFKSFWERTVPRDMDYEHHQSWGEFNGFAHIRTSLLGVSVVIPFADKKLTLGTWQQVLLLDFDDKPKTRQIVVQIMGES